MKPSLFEYEGYKIASRMGENGVGDVRVYDPRHKRDPALFETTSLDIAMRWIIDYKRGAQWAVAARKQA